MGRIIFNGLCSEEKRKGAIKLMNILHKDEGLARYMHRICALLLARQSIETPVISSQVVVALMECVDGSTENIGCWIVLSAIADRRPDMINVDHLKKIY